MDNELFKIYVFFCKWIFWIFFIVEEMENIGVNFIKMVIL